MGRRATWLYIGIAVAPVATACGDNQIDRVGAAGVPTNASLVQDVPVIDVGIASEPPRPFLIDTGAYFTGIDTDSYPAFASDQGLHRLALRAFAMRFAWPVAAADLFPYRLASGEVVHGLIGGDLLGELELSIDYQTPRVWLAEPGADPLAEPAIEIDGDVVGGGALIVPGNCAGGCGTFDAPPSRFLVEVSVEAYTERLRFLVDTGSSVSVMTEFDMTRIGDRGRPRLPTRIGTSGGPVDATITRLASMRAGAAELTSVPVLVLPGGPGIEGLSVELGQRIDGILGGSFLREFLVTVDYAGERLRLAPYPDRRHIDPREYIGLGFRLELDATGEWLVGLILPGRDAEAAGIAEGDRVVALDGEIASGHSLDELEQIVAAHDIGATVAVDVERDGEALSFAVKVEDLLPAFTD